MNICVYGAASSSIDKTYLAAGRQLGELLAERGHTLIFGGGDNGLMGAVASGVTAAGGNCIGIVPSFFNVDGVLYGGCTELIYTDTMRERKQLMESRADAFIVTPGGIGTFEEFLEILTLRHLNRHRKPIAVLNTGGYYDTMNALLQKAVTEQFMSQETMGMYRCFDEPEALLDYLETASAAD